MAIVVMKILRGLNRVGPIASRFYSSALFVSGKKANESYAVLTPSLDFDERFSDVNKLSGELESRGIKLDLENLKKKWDFYKEIDSNRSTLEQKRVDIAQRIKIISKKTEQNKDDENEINRLKTLGKIIREDLKIAKEALWELEESVIPQALRLPNFLHKDTPKTDPEVLYSFGNPVNSASAKSHVAVGKDLVLLEYSSPMSYYLTGDAAFFELAVLRLSALILSENNIVRVTGLDFSRGIIVEGSGLDHEDYRDSFTLRDNEEIEKHSSNRMHLVGGASLQSFLAMHTKQLINPNHFPLRYFATGRQYSPFSANSKENGLFTVCQSSAVQVFALLNKTSVDDCAVEFDRIIDTMKIVYESICSHYKIVVRPARELKPWESLRVSFEMWSPCSNEYVEVGNLSMCGEYFSKRLLIGCQSPTGRTFPSVISGTVLSVPRLLGCLMEDYPEKLFISDKVKEHMPI